MFKVFFQGMTYRKSGVTEESDLLTIPLMKKEYLFYIVAFQSSLKKGPANSLLGVFFLLTQSSFSSHQVSLAAWQYVTSMFSKIFVRG